jgi:hypothetical protein
MKTESAKIPHLKPKVPKYHSFLEEEGHIIPSPALPPSVVSHGRFPTSVMIFLPYFLASDCCVKSIKARLRFCFLYFGVDTIGAFQVEVDVQSYLTIADGREVYKKGKAWSFVVDRGSEKSGILAL